MTLYEFLLNKGYSEEKAKKYIIWFENSVPLPKNIKIDIKEYYKKHYSKPLKVG